MRADWAFLAEELPDSWVIRSEEMCMAITGLIPPWCVTESTSWSLRSHSMLACSRQPIREGHCFRQVAIDSLGAAIPSSRAW